MDLPITDEELTTIINAMSLGGDTSLYQKLKLVKGQYLLTFRSVTKPDKPLVYK